MTPVPSLSHRRVVAALVRPRLAAAKKLIASLRRPSDLQPSMVRIVHGRLDMTLKGEIGADDGFTAAQVANVLKRYPKASHVDVTINSPGGSLAEALSIYDSIRAHKGFITTIAEEECCSAATLILMAGELRQAYAGTKLLLHRASIDPEDVRSVSAERRWTSKKLKQTAGAVDRMDGRMLDIYAKHCGNRPFFEKEIETEEFLSLAAAQAHSIIHCLAGSERWIAGRPYYC